MSPPGRHGPEGATFVAQGDNAVATPIDNCTTRLSARSQFRKTQPEATPESTPGCLLIPERAARRVAR